MNRSLAGAALACATLLSPAALAGNVSLSFNGIPGTIEVLSFSWGATNSATVGGGGGGGGAGRVTFNEFTFSATEHSTSPAHFENVASGRHITGARLTVMHPDTGKPQSEWTLTDVLVTSFGVANGEPDPKGKQPNTLGVPVTKVALSFAKACYKVFAGDGSVRENCWNAVTNSAS